MKLKLLLLASIAALAALAALALAGPSSQAQAPAVAPPPPPPQAVQPMVFGFPMPDFTLPAIQGGAFGPSALKGKNVLLVFPRGKVDDTWCWLCHYQYAELADLEARLGLRKAFNLEVLFVLPYGEAEVRHWAEIFPGQMAEILKWLNPPGAESFPAPRKERLDRIRRRFPKVAEYAKGPVATPFPILYDQDQAVSKRLGLFTKNWDASAVDQNIPTTVLLDAAGDIVFKYTSQITFDRPSGEYLVRMMAELLEPAGPPPADPKDAAIATALDYSDGAYSGDAGRMERALHSDLNKLSFVRRSPAAGLEARYSTVSDLVELTRPALFFVEPEKRRTEVSVLEMTDDVACLKVRTARWCDYLQLIKVGGRWKIVNVLWTSGLDVPADKKAVPGFDAAKEQPAARAAAADYLEGALAGDADRLGRALHQETNQLVFMAAPKTNAGFVIRTRYSGLLEPAKAGTALAPADARTAEVRMLDLMDGMAFAAARTARGGAYLQLQLLDGQWKVINVLVRPDQNVLGQAPPAKK